MPNFAIIENGKVVNAVISEADYATEQGWIALPDSAGIGWDYVNGQFINNRPAPVVVTPPTPTKEELLAQLNAIQAQIQAL
jgi:hypothetical protein